MQQGVSQVSIDEGGALPDTPLLGMPMPWANFQEQQLRQLGE